MPNQALTELFHFTSAALPPETFHVTHFHGTEGLNTLFSFTIGLVSQNIALDVAKVLEEPASFIIRRDTGEDAVFMGFPAHLQQGGMYNGYAYYEVELRPAFWKLTQVVQSAIFLNKTIEDVANELLNSQQFFAFPHEFRFVRTDYPRPEFAMQYGESVYDYLLWRMEEQGAYFFFSPEGDKIIFADAPQSHEAAPILVYYAPTSGLEGEKREEVLTAFTLMQIPLPRKVVVRSFDWKNPARPVIGEAEVSASGVGDVYLTNENVESDAEATRIASIRAEERMCASRTFTGVGSVPLLRPGVVFSLQGHYTPDFNRDYMVTHITHEGAQETFLSLGLGIPLREKREHLFYRNSFSCIDASVPYRPARTAPRAKISGVIRAFVDGGGSGARAELDEYGRYKLLFPFDISGRKGGNASCWIRMSQPQVGKDSGLSFPLLPGAEVTVAFIDGNPDRPIITGALPNGETGALTGSGNANFSGIRTPGGNQITINDTDTHQGIALQTPSGLGITMTAGSLGATTQHHDLAIDMVSVAGNEFANLAKTLITGCKTISTATQDCYAWITAISTALQNGICSSLNSLAAKAAKKDLQASEDFKWGSDAVKTACMLCTNLATSVKTWKAPANNYGVSLTGSEKAASSILQVWPGWGKMLGLIITWLAGRIIQFGAEGLDSVLEVATAKDDAQKKMDDDLEKAGATKPQSDDERKSSYTEMTNALVKEIADAMAKGDAATVQKLQKQLKALEDDYAALYDEKSTSYYKYAKQDTIRRAMVSTTKDMLPEITALILQFKALGGQGKEHGGISLMSPDKNINLNAKRTISLHSGDGIFLNTDRDTDSGVWGVKADTTYKIGKKTLAKLKPFVAVKTANHYVEADNNEEAYVASTTKADSYMAAHTEGKDFLWIGKDTVSLTGKNIACTVNTGNKPSITANPDGITLFADANQQTGISVSKKDKELSLHNESACMGINSKGQVILESKNGAKLVLDKGLSLVPKNGKTYVSKICVNGANLTALNGGIINLGGQVKIMGTNASDAAELTTQINDLLTAVKNQTAAIKEAQAAAEAARDEAVAAAEKAVKEASVKEAALPPI